MPYINPTARTRYDDAIEAFPVIQDKGDLTYIINRLMLRFAYEHGLVGYQRHSDAVAATADAGHEYRRRVLDEYEDLKILENGDIFAIYRSSRRI